MVFVFTGLGIGLGNYWYLWYLFDFCDRIRIDVVSGGENVSGT